MVWLIKIVVTTHLQETLVHLIIAVMHIIIVLISNLKPLQCVVATFLLMFVTLDAKFTVTRTPIIRKPF